MKNKQLVQQIKEQIHQQIMHVNEGEIEHVLRALAIVIAQNLAEGEAFTLPGVGILKPVQRAARQDRNPQTGEALTIPAKTEIRFKPLKALHYAIGNYQTTGAK